MARSRPRKARSCHKCIYFYKSKKKQEPGKPCDRRGRCTKFGFYPSSAELGATCKGFDNGEEKQPDPVPAIRKSPRKRCNTCVNFVYSVNPMTRRGEYHCKQKDKWTRNYTVLRNCSAPDFQRKKAE